MSPLEKENFRNCKITAMVTEKTKQRLVFDAKKLGRPMSNYVAHIITIYFENKDKNKNQEDSFE